MDDTLYLVNRDTNASLKLVQNRLPEQPDILQGLRTEYENVSPVASNSGTPEKIDYASLVTTVNNYTGECKKIIRKVNELLNEHGLTKDDLRKEVNGPEHIKYLTLEQREQLNDKTDNVTIKEMRNDIYERKQQVDKTLATMSERIQKCNKWFEEISQEGLPHIPEDLQEVHQDAHQQFVQVKENFQNIQGSIERSENYGDLDQHMFRIKKLSKTIGKIEQAELVARRFTAELVAQQYTDELAAQRSAADLAARRFTDELAARQHTAELAAQQYTDELAAQQYTDEQNNLKISQLRNKIKRLRNKTLKKIAERLSKKIFACSSSNIAQD